MHVLVAGAGWLGGSVARALVGAGHRVTAVRRDPGRSPVSGGFAWLPLDLAAPDAWRALPRDLDAVVACQSAGADGVEAYRRAYVDCNRTLLDALRDSARPAAFLYTGSTGVFGQRDGGDVDEETPPAPASPSAEVLVRAEEQVRAAARDGIRASVLRLSGLYGPGRTWPVDRVRSGQLALGPGDGAWLNLCHLDDAVSAVVAGIERAPAGGVLHASDAEPVRRRDLVRWTSERLGIDPPRLPPDARPSAGPDRRVLAERSRALLGIELRFPTFREGLDGLLAR